MAARTARKTDKRRFYERALSAAEAAELPEALEVDGVEAEIAALRVRLRTAVEEHPEDLELMLKGVDVLRRLVVSRYGLTRGEGRETSAYAEETLRRVRLGGEGRRDDGG